VKFEKKIWELAHSWKKENKKKESKKHEKQKRSNVRLLYKFRHTLKNLGHIEKQNKSPKIQSVEVSHHYHSFKLDMCKYLPDVLLGLTCAGRTTNWRIGIGIEEYSAVSFHKIYKRQIHRLISWIKRQASILQSNREKQYVNSLIPNHWLH